MAHRNVNDIRAMKNHGLIIKSCSCTNVCEMCNIGKMARKPFPKKAVFDCVVSDVCGISWSKKIFYNIYWYL